MPPRGSYAKGRAKRAEILDAAPIVIAREGYSGATVRQLAEEVSLSQNGLLHHFGSKDALFTEILRHEDERAAASLERDPLSFSDVLVDRILMAIDDEDAAPGMPQLAVRLSAEATEPSHAAHTFFAQRYRAIREVVVAAVTEMKDRGDVAEDVDPVRVASLIYASWDGLRIQRMYDPATDVRSHMVYLVQRLGLFAPAPD